ncbi:hypothetical protein M3J09_002877 [Ascochyta lentis]
MGYTMGRFACEDDGTYFRAQSAFIKMTSRSLHSPIRIIPSCR